MDTNEDQLVRPAVPLQDLVGYAGEGAAHIIGPH
jgi:hypothetical protein